jgi:hypothetical protein
MAVLPPVDLDQAPVADEPPSARCSAANAAAAVVPAIGEVVDPTGFEALIRSNGFIPANDNGVIQGHPGVFAGGDALGTRGTVIGAIGDGRRAAEAIDCYVAGRPEPALGKPGPIGVDKLNLGREQRVAK